MFFNLKKIICIYLFLGVTDCTLPWNKPKSVTDVSKLGVLGVVEYGLTNICPSVLSGPNKEYCCYTISGDVKCCDQQESAVFGYVSYSLFCIRYFLFIYFIYT